MTSYLKQLLNYIYGTDKSELHLDFNLPNHIKDDDHFDVIIVGSGLSGLTTAYRLSQYGLKIAVIEATDQIGGRTRSFKMSNGDLISYGGTWSTFEDLSTIGLAYEIDCLPFVPDVKLQLNDLTNLITHPYLLIKLWLIGKKILSTGDDYWNSPLAKKYDKISLTQWLLSKKGFTNEEASRQAVLDYLYGMESYSFNLDNLSCFFAAVMIYVRLSNITTTGLLFPKLLRWNGGTGIFVSKLAQQIAKSNNVVFKCSEIITDLIQMDTQVIVKTNNLTLKANRVVVATSPLAAMNIKYTPNLPELSKNLFSSIVPWNDPALNLILVFKEHWGVGLMPLMNYRFPVEGIDGPIFDLTPNNSTKGIYRLLCNPDFVKGWTVDQIKESALKLFISYYPDKEVIITSLFEELIILNWLDSQPWIPAVAYYYPPGILSNYGSAMRQSFDKIYWAGSEKATRGLHWIEGAIDRGNQVAEELLLNLNKINNPTQYRQFINDFKNKGLTTVKNLDNLQNFENLINTIKSTFSALFRIDNLTDIEQRIFNKFKTL